MTSAMDRGLAALAGSPPPSSTTGALVPDSAYSAMWFASAIGMVGGGVAIPVGGAMALAGHSRGKTVATVGALTLGVSSIPVIALIAMWARKN